MSRCGICSGLRFMQSRARNSASRSSLAVSRRARRSMGISTWERRNIDRAWRIGGQEVNRGDPAALGRGETLNLKPWNPYATDLLAPSYDSATAAVALTGGVPRPHSNACPLGACAHAPLV